jgi:hypothetical protein
VTADDEPARTAAIEHIASGFAMLDGVHNWPDWVRAAENGHAGDCTDQPYTCAACYVDRHRRLAHRAVDWADGGFDSLPIALRGAIVHLSEGGPLPGDFVRVMEDNIDKLYER